MRRGEVARPRPPVAGDFVRPGFQLTPEAATIALGGEPRARNQYDFYGGLDQTQRARALGALPPEATPPKPPSELDWLKTYFEGLGLTMDRHAAHPLRPGETYVQREAVDPTRINPSLEYIRGKLPFGVPTPNPATQQVIDNIMAAPAPERVRMLDGLRTPAGRQRAAQDGVDVDMVIGAF
jgi:hypothetical protein